MEIIEEFIQSKTGRMETCEDGIFVNEHFAVIIDGVTNKNSKKYNDKTPGRIARDSVLEILPYMNPDVSAENFFKLCNESIASWYKKNNLYIEMKEHINQRCTASIISYSNKRRQIWIVGNGLAIFGDQYIDNTKLVDIINAEIRSYFIQCEIKRGVSEYELYEHDTGRDFIMPLLLRQILFQNSDQPGEFNYYDIDGFFTNNRGIHVYDVASGVTEVAMSSDGYPEIFRALEKSEKYLAKILKEDPLQYKKHKSTHGFQRGNISYDDRSYVRIKI